MSLLILFGPIALFAYFCGCINGALMISHLFYHDDIRRYGSGNAGLTNFYRTYGAKHLLLVVILDMGKAFLAVWFSGVWLRNGIELLLLNLVPTESFTILLKYVAGLFCVIGHMFPLFSHFKGGKGILCSATLLLALDWRVALVGWGLFFLCVVATKYVSLGSIVAAVSFPITTWLIYQSVDSTAVAFSIAVLVIFAHRQNIQRLCHGTENQFHLKK